MFIHITESYAYMQLLNISLFPLVATLGSFLAMKIGSPSWKIFMALLGSGFLITLGLLVLWWYDTYYWFL